MKKIFGLFKKKDDHDEETKQQQEEANREDLPTKDKDSSSNSNSDSAQKEARLEEIKRSMMERRIKKFDDMLNQQKQFVDLEKLRGLSWNGVPSNSPHYRC